LQRYCTNALFALACLLAAAAGVAAQIGGSPVQELAFGKFVAASGGSVTVSPAGARSASGSVFLVPSGAWSAAQFMVTGDPDLAYSISLPANGTVTLNSGANSMALSNFTSNPAATGQLSGGGAQMLAVGATLSVANGQPRGSYTGAFEITIHYN
jgi:hypothetical protein